ncbi:hypothetical protein [Streptomyces sp. CoH17]|uniref:hypothetical protein n=1 Tax=Streptomyces sp. CoH17 TaxID=2992806 RepID=UPI00226EDABD|nr:hypothetical protein [Streptomyces sp. CoH17]
MKRINTGHYITVSDGGKYEAIMSANIQGAGRWMVCENVEVDGKKFQRDPEGVDPKHTTYKSAKEQIIHLQKRDQEQKSQADGQSES